MESEQSYKSNIRVLLVAGNSALGCFFFGYCLSYMNVSFKTICLVFEINKDNQDTIEALINCLLPLGAGFGAFGSGLLLQVVRRKNALMITDIIGIIGVLLGLIDSLNILFVSRFILGLAVGLNSAIIPLYIKEQTPNQMRGVAGSLNQITVNIGIQIPFFLGLLYAVPPTADSNYWMVVFGLPLIFCVLRSFILQFIFNDDPPSYYVDLGQEEKALQVLEKIYKQPYIQEQLTELQKERRQKAGKTSKYSDLCSQLYSKRLLVGCLLCVLQQFCGINSVIFYSNKIFEQLSDNQTVINWLTIAVGFTNIIFSMLAGYLMKGYGRKQLLVFGNIICFLCLFTLFILSYFNTSNETQSIGATQISIVILIYLYLIGFQLSLGPITWIYIADILPEKGVSIAVLVNWICVTLISFGFPIIVEKAGITYCFLIFTITCFLGIFFLQFMVIETRGKTAESIDNMYSFRQYLLTDKVEDTEKPTRD